MHSLSARSSRDRQAATATAAAILRPAHLTQTNYKLVEAKINAGEMLLSSPHACLVASLDVLGFPHSVRHGPSQTGCKRVELYGDRDEWE